MLRIRSRAPCARYSSAARTCPAARSAEEAKSRRSVGPRSSFREPQPSVSLRRSARLSRHALPAKSAAGTGHPALVERLQQRSRTSPHGHQERRVIQRVERAAGGGCVDPARARDPSGRKCDADAPPRLCALTPPPPGRAARLNTDTNVILLSRGVALAFKCTSSWRNPCERQARVDDPNIAQVYPAHLAELEWYAAGNLSPTSWVIVGLCRGETTMRVAGEDPLRVTVHE